MIILNKSVESAADVKKVLTRDSCPINDCINSILGDVNLDTYEDYVSWALDTMKNNIPSPFDRSYPNCYTMNLGDCYFTIRIPNLFGFGLKVFPKRGKIQYEISIIYNKELCFVVNTEEYKKFIDDGWTTIERFSDRRKDN